MKNYEAAKKSETVFKQLLERQTKLVASGNPQKIQIEPNEVDKYFILELSLLVLFFGVFVTLLVILIQNYQLANYLRGL